MNPANWERLGELFEMALTLPPGERAEFIESSAGNDREMRDELVTLLEASHGADDYLNSLHDQVFGSDIRGALQDVLDGSEASDPWIGRSVSHYRILAPLVGGGMGVVYRAEDSRLGRQVAIKFIAPEISRDPEAIRRFLLEAQTASSLDHQNICTIHEISESDDGRLFIVMTLYEGETLRTRLKRGPLSPDDVAELGVQVATALDVAHSRGIVHRDVKPANVFITDEGVVKLLDFGLAQTDDAVSRTGGLKGTVAYMSPEQARGERADERSDVWAAGVMLYEMLLGEHPFAAENPQAAIHRILTQEPDRLAELEARSPGVATAVRRALSRSPERRLQDGGALLEALHACTSITEPAGAAAGVHMPGRLVGAIAAVLILAGAAFVVARVMNEPDDLPATGAGPTSGDGATAGAAPTVSRILWVDDNPENNVDAVLELKDRGVEVATSLTTSDAVGRYHPEIFQLVVSDMGRYEGPSGEYRGRAGFDLLTRLLEIDPGVRVAFCTSLRALAEHREEALAAGAHGIYADCTEVVSLVH